MEEERSVGLEEEEAKGAVAEGAVGVVGIIPMLESGEVPVNAADEGVAAVVAGREGEQVADVDEGHLD